MAFCIGCVGLLSMTRADRFVVQESNRLFYALEFWVNSWFFGTAFRDFLEPHDLEVRSSAADWPSHQAALGDERMENLEI